MTKRLFLACLIASAHHTLSADSFATTIRTVALTGQPAPGTEPGTTFGGELRDPVINNAGQVAFRGFVAGDSVIVAGPENVVGNSLGVWSEGSGELRLVAREGSSAPGTDAVFYRSGFNNLRINDAGQVVIGAVLFGESVGSFHDSGVWSEADGAGNGLTLIAQERITPAPGTPAGILIHSPGPNLGVINSTGRVSITATLDGPGLDSTNNAGVWSQNTSGELQLRMRTGEQAPGLDPNVMFIGRGTPVFNNPQDFVFRAEVAGPDITAANDSGLWIAHSEGLALVAREGGLAPGTTAGETFGAIPSLSISINNAGQVAFNATLLGAMSTTNRGVWSNASGELALVARKGDAAPGTSGNFSDLFGPFINGAGHTAFVAQSTTGSGIWRETDDGLSLVAIQGMQAPGLDEGIRLGALIHFLDGATPFVFNGAGQMAFVAPLDVFGSTPFGSVTSANNTTLYATIDGELTLIARKGDLFEVAPGDFRTIAGLFLSAGSGNEDSIQSGFNNRGQLAFRLSFTDGSQGIFVHNTVVPEPSSIAIVSLVGLVLCSGRSRNLRWLASRR
jgi:hypothetical protein